MVKNLPTIERSTKIRFGKQAPINQADNTIVLNASSTAINAPTGDSIYMSPLRVTNPASTTVIGYNPTTKELYNTNVLTSDIGSGGGGGGNITLGTGTTGDYISTITGGNGITSTGATSGETIAHTLSVDAKTNGGLVIESNQLAVDLSASAITGTLAVGNGGTGATTLTSGKIPYIKSDNTFGDSEMSYNDVTDVTSLSSNLTVTGTTTSNVVLAGGYVNESTAQYFTVTAVTGLFIVDGVNQPVLTLYRGVTYRFDYSDSSNTSHPLRISTTSEGEQYNTGYSSFGNRGTAGAYIQFIVPMEAPDTMYYNCGAHPGMGNTINIISPSLTSSVSTVSSNVFIGNHVGIGTSSPSYPLDVTGNMNVTGGLRVNDSTGTSGEVLTSSGGGVMSWGSVGTTQGGTGVTTGLTVLDPNNLNGPVSISKGGTGATTLNNLITLGSHTTGNYVQSISGGNGIVAGAASEGGTPTVAIDTKEDGGLVIESNQLAVDLSASSITGTLAVGDGGTGATTLNNLITLGSHTTGNYVQSISGGNGIVAGAASEGGTPTVAIDTKEDGGLVIESNQLAVDLSASSITGTLAVGDGGTNISSYAAGDIIYANGSSSLTNLGIGSAGEVLTVSGGNPSWAAASASSPWTTSGNDIVYNTGEVIIGSYISYDGPPGDVSRFGFPQNNTFTVTTNNTERLRIDSSGDVGIGTTNPGYPLDITGNMNVTGGLRANGAAGSNGQVLTSSGGGAMSWTTPSSGASSPWTTSGNDIVYNTGEVIIGSYISYDGPPGDVSRFGFPQNNTFTVTTNNTERLRIDSSGDVGIGTTNPGYPLDITGNMNVTGGLRANGAAGSNGQVLTSSGGGAMTWTTPSSGGGFSGDIADYITHTDDSNTKFGFPTSDTFTITTSNIERLRIDSGGEVSIGSDNDIGSGHKMTIVGGSTSNDSSYADLVVTNLNEHNNARLLLGTPYNTNSSSAFKAAIIADGGGSSSRCDLHFCLENTSSNTPNADLSDSKMMIKYATGNVGIGTTTPDYKLDVSGSVRGTSFAGSGYSLTSLQASNITSGTLAVARGGTGQSSYSTGDIIYANSSTSLTKLGIGSAGEVLTVSGGNPSWAAASGGGGGGGATAGTVTTGDDGMSAITVSGSAYDYMYHQTPHNIAFSSSNFNSISISQAMTHGQKLIMKLYTSSSSCQAKIARGRDLSVTINGTTHDVNNSNFREHTLSFPYDSDPTPSKFLILEITKEDTNKVTIEAKLSTADFTKTAECDGAWSYDGVDTFNRETAIHNVIYGGLQSIYGSQLKLKFSYFGIGHSHDIYFKQDDPSGLSVAASQIEFYYNNSSSSWSQASQTNVYTNFDKSTNLNFTQGKYYHIHHEVLRASSDDYPSEILFTVEELNAASGGGGGGGGGSDFTTNMTRASSNPPTYRNGIEIDTAFSAANYNYNTGFYDFMNSSWPPFETLILDHTLPTSMPIEYDFYFTGYSGNITASSFKVYYNGYQKDTYHSFPGTGSTSYNFNQSDRYSVTFKARDTSGNDWTATWKEYKN